MATPINLNSPGGRFHVARKRAGLTQKDIATQADVTQSTVSDFENGKIADILAWNLVRMCALVSVTVEYVMLGARAARDDEEAEALFLLRGAGDVERRQALKSLRGMLEEEPQSSTTSRKRQSNGT